MFSVFLIHLGLAALLFALVAVGYAPMRWLHWPQFIATALNRFVFSVALPALLFRMMSGFSHLPPVDSRLMIAFFGGCLLVFGIGRWISWRLLRLDGVAQSVFAMAGIFSNNVLSACRWPRRRWARPRCPRWRLVLAFNSLILWTLVTVSIEWARHGSLSFAGIGKTAKAIATNPIVASIVSGTLFGMAGFSIPALIDTPLALLGAGR